MYHLDGRTAATTAAVDRAIAVLWNQSATRTIKAVQHRFVAANAPGAGASYTLKRVTARGTPTVTATPTIANDSRRLQAPPSGAVIDLAWSAQPTFEEESFLGWVLAAVTASGIIEPYPGDGIDIPPGAGLALVTSNTVVIPVGGAGFSWNE